MCFMLETQRTAVERMSSAFPSSKIFSNLIRWALSLHPGVRFQWCVSAALIQSDYACMGSFSLWVGVLFVWWFSGHLFSHSCFRHILNPRTAASRVLSVWVMSECSLRPRMKRSAVTHVPLLSVSSYYCTSWGLLTHSGLLGFFVKCTVYSSSPHTSTYSCPAKVYD